MVYSDVSLLHGSVSENDWRWHLSLLPQAMECVSRDTMTSIIIKLYTHSCILHYQLFCSVDFIVIYFSLFCLILESVDERFAVLAIVRPIKLFRYIIVFIAVTGLVETHTIVQ